MKDLPHQVPDQRLAPEQRPVKEHEMTLGVDLGHDMGQQEAARQTAAVPDEPDAVQGVGEHGGNEDPPLLERPRRREDRGDGQHAVEDGLGRALIHAQGMKRHGEETHLISTARPRLWGR